MKFKISIIAALLLAMMILTFTGCGTSPANSGSSVDNSTAAEQAAGKIDGKTVMVYCGAGMKDPFTEIAKSFEEETGAVVELTFGNAANIISQITASNQGDLFIAGAETELKSLKEQNYVTDTKPLVKHIPVVAVTEGNPKGIQTIADLGREDVTLILGDAESTPIGKIADAVLSDAGMSDTANILARTATAPEMITALQTEEADAAIVWKENASGKDKIMIPEMPEMEQYIKTIPAASLSCTNTDNAEVLEAFLDYLDTEKAKNIWISYGYELAE